MRKWREVSGKMLAKVNSCAVIGLEGTLVDVEVDLARGLPAFSLVGLPDMAVQESKERVRAAVKNSGLTFPGQRVTVNLAPADLRKEGPSYDLPIALAILAASGQIPPDALDGAIAVGELSLDGGVRHVRGVLPVVHTAQEAGLTRVFVPAEDAAEAALIPDIEVIPVDHVITLAEHLLNLSHIPAFDRSTVPPPPPPSDSLPDMADVKGQEHVKRALEVAAAGGHNVLMVGPPGTGKTLLARALAGILPRMTLKESLEVTRIYSVADLLPGDTPLIQVRPFRAPHHTISHAGLVGGGRSPRPGEVSLAHRGVLFLDELPEFGGKNLETLRQPLEDRRITITRAAGTMTFPANLLLVAAMNPCPCGFYNDPVRPCSCSHASIERYRRSISGPLLDRMDIHIEVPNVDYDKLSDDRRGEPSEAIRGRVQAARDRQLARFAGTHMTCNDDMTAHEVPVYCQLTPEAEKLMRSAMTQMHLSARAYHRVLKMALTIADLAGEATIQAPHLAEALQYRRRVS
jgi:magnesium chelatase family protein